MEYYRRLGRKFPTLKKALGAKLRAVPDQTETQQLAIAKAWHARTKSNAPPPPWVGRRLRCQS